MVSSIISKIQNTLPTSRVVFTPSTSNIADKKKKIQIKYFVENCIHVKFHQNRRFRLRYVPLSVSLTLPFGQQQVHFHREKRSFLWLSDSDVEAPRASRPSRDLDVSLHQAPRAAWICMQIPFCVQRLSGNRSANRHGWHRYFLNL